MFSTPSTNLSQFNVEPGMVVADLGCGSGEYVFDLINRIGNSGKIYALDVQNNLVEKLSNTCKQKGLTNVSVLWDDLDDENGIGLQDNSIDRAIVSNILFQVEDILRFAQQVKRILKPNGQVLVVDWSDSFNGLGPSPQSIVSADRAKDLFTRAGFTLSRDIQAGDHHYGFVMKSNI